MKGKALKAVTFNRWRWCIRPGRDSYKCRRAFNMTGSSCHGNDEPRRTAGGFTMPLAAAVLSNKRGGGGRCDF